MKLPQAQTTILNLSLKGSPAYLKWCELVDALNEIRLILPLANAKKTYHGATFFIDGGVNYLPPHPSSEFFCLGDGDSADENKMQLLFPRAKDYTDLELALALIPGHFKNVLIDGVWGKEKDHELANLGAINQFLMERSQIFYTVIDEKHYFLNSGEHNLEIKGKFSLLSFLTSQIKIQGDCEFKINNFLELKPLSGKGISNNGQGQIRISVKNPVLLYLPAQTHCKSIASSALQSDSK